MGNAGSSFFGYLTYAALLLAAASQALLWGGILAALAGGAVLLGEILFDPRGSREYKWSGWLIRGGLWAAGGGFLVGLLAGAVIGTAMGLSGNF